MSFEEKELLEKQKEFRCLVDKFGIDEAIRMHLEDERDERIIKFNKELAQTKRREKTEYNLFSVFLGSVILGLGIFMDGLALMTESFWDFVLGVVGSYFMGFIVYVFKMFLVDPFLDSMSSTYDIDLSEEDNAKIARCKRIDTLKAYALNATVLPVIALVAHSLLH